MQPTGSTVAEIIENIRQQVQSGALPAGQPLPPVRALAARLGVNRNTVASAYKRLGALGIAETRGRLGTRIAARTTSGEQDGGRPDSTLTDVASGNPHSRWLPDLAHVLASSRAAPRLYGEAPMNAGLVELGRHWFEADCPPDFELDLTHGAVEAIERLAAAHLVTGDAVAVEDPCFLGAISALRIAGMNAIGIPVDAEGMRPEALGHALRRGARAVLITPRAHNPTGASLTPRRAAALREVLARFPLAFVIVDDHYALLSDTPYASVLPPTTLRWALVRSVSKALGPDLRVAFVASDRVTSQRLRLRLSPGLTWVSHLLQDIVETCLRSPATAKMIQQARRSYQANREDLVRMLRGRGIEVPAPSDGFNVWLPLASDSNRIALDMARLGWLVRAGESFGVQAPTPALRLTVSSLADDQTKRLADDLIRCL